MLLSNGRKAKLLLTALALSQGIAQSLAPTAYAQVQPLNASVSHDVAPTTVLPTDVVPLPASDQRMSFGQNLQFQALDKLPARFYFNVSLETTLRDETNPFQYPNKRNYLKRFVPPPFQFAALPSGVQQQYLTRLGNVDKNQGVFRVLPNITAGWALTPNTRVYGNYFMLRDSLFHSPALDTTLQSLSYGIQNTRAVGKRGSLQTDFSVRSMFQYKNRPAYDFLPNITYSYVLTPRTVLYASALLQMRGNQYYDAPSRELDPFYTVGAMYYKGPWTFSATATYVQNFRQMFGGNALIPQDNYSWICDFEIDKRLFKQVPGLVAFVRAEPVFNFHSKDTPGLAGNDFRFYSGIRVSLAKPPLTQALQQIRQQIEDLNEPLAPDPGQTAGKEAGPQAYIMPYQVIANTPQPIHGLMDKVELPGAEQGQVSMLGYIHPAIESDSSL